MPQDITLETLLAAQAALAEKQKKHDQYAKELVAAERRAVRLVEELATANKSFDEIKKAYEAGVKSGPKEVKKTA